jgi:glycosyltransferase involved in cell wall biosynthesis
MNNKIAFFNRHAPHYRKGIYLLMEKDLDVEFYFGDKRPGQIKKLDYKILKNFKQEFNNIDFGPFYWQSGALKLLFKPYRYYITPGDFFCFSNWIFLLLAKFTKKKVYLWSHGLYGNETFAKKLIKRIFYSFADGFFLYGEYAKGNMIREGYAADKLKVIYNSLDYENQLARRKFLVEDKVYFENFKNSNKVLLFVGRLTKIKMLDQLFQALKTLKDDGSNFNLILIGDGEEKETLIELSKKFNLESSIWFYGPCYDESILSRLIYNADLCVSPGNVGLTAMHSMIYGTPVLTHNCFPLQMPEFEAIKEGVTGSFFKQNDIKSLSEAIVTWEGNAADRNFVRQKCFEIMDEKYNPSYQVEIMKSILK